MQILLLHSPRKYYYYYYSQFGGDFLENSAEQHSFSPSLFCYIIHSLAVGTWYRIYIYCYVPAHPPTPTKVYFVIFTNLSFKYIVSHIQKDSFLSLYSKMLLNTVKGSCESGCVCVYCKKVYKIS